MRKKFTEDQKLRFWMDGEFAIVHAMFAFVAILIVENLFGEILLWLYLIYSLIYAAVRFAVVADQDPKYLRVPPDDPDLVRHPRVQ